MPDFVSRDLTVNETPERSSGPPFVATCRRFRPASGRFAPSRRWRRKIDDTQPTTGYEDVKRIAISRSVVDNVETIQVDWALYGPKLAQVGLTFGADDIDSVSPRTTIHWAPPFAPRGDPQQHSGSRV